MPASSCGSSLVSNKLRSEHGLGMAMNALPRASGHELGCGSHGVFASRLLLSVEYIPPSLQCQQKGKDRQLQGIGNCSATGRDKNL